MNKIAPQDIGKVLGKLPKNLPIPDVTKTFNLLLEYKKESEITKRDIARYDAMKDVMISEITHKYAFYEKLFASVFAERNTAVQKFFEVIDTGIKEHNTELMLAGLSGLSNVVASSPFAGISELRNAIDSNTMIEL